MTDKLHAISTQEAHRLMQLLHEGHKAQQGCIHGVILYD
jgi:hypothetical protein